MIDLRTFFSLLSLIFLGSFVYANDEYELASEKFIRNAQTVEARFDQTMSDGYQYIYWITLNGPVSSNGKPTLTFQNSSKETVYTIDDYSGSIIRKELTCKDKDGNTVTIVFKLEEAHGARNANVLKMYVDSFIGKPRRSNHTSIDATLVQNNRIKKTYQSASIFFYKENSAVTKLKNKPKANIYPTFFEWLDEHCK